MPLLEINDLSVRFHSYRGVVEALDRISFAIEHGESFGLVGESGCGKSLTAQTILGLVPSSGEIVGGSIRFCPDPTHPASGEMLLALKEASLRKLRGKRIAMIFQEPNAALDPIMSIGRQVAEPFYFHDTDRLSVKVLEELEADPKKYGWWIPLLRPLYARCVRDPESIWLRLLDRLPFFKRWRAPLWEEAQQHAAVMLGRLGIPNPREVTSQYPHHLSGGMKQRAVIAMALAADPLLLIADEATSNLDVTIQAQILELITDLKQRTLGALLFITHDLGLVAEICDRAGVMYAGTLCEVAAVAELFTNPCHPYTRALLDSVPKLAAQGPLNPIAGSVPNLMPPPAGCRFHPRCPSAAGTCATLKPELEAISPTHQVACHHWKRMR